MFYILVTYEKIKDLQGVSFVTNYGKRKWFLLIGFISNKVVLHTTIVSSYGSNTTFLQVNIYFYKRAYVFKQKLKHNVKINILKIYLYDLILKKINFFNLLDILLCILNSGLVALPNPAVTII